jgi:hypothetical protein
MEDTLARATASVLLLEILVSVGGEASHRRDYGWYLVQILQTESNDSRLFVSV